MKSTPFKSQFARKLSIGDRVSVGTDAVNELEEPDDIITEDPSVFDNIPQLSISDPSDGDSSSDEEGGGITSPVAAAFRGRTASSKRVRDSPDDNPRNTRSKSGSSSRLPTKK